MQSLQVYKQARIVVHILIINQILLGRAFSTYGEKRNVYWVLLGKPERKRQLGTSRRRCGIILKWVSNVMCVYWTNLAEDLEKLRAVVNTVMNLWVS